MPVPVLAPEGEGGLEWDASEWDQSWKVRVSSAHASLTEGLHEAGHMHARSITYPPGGRKGEGVRRSGPGFQLTRAGPADACGSHS